jgi:hypothetical protein
MEEALEAGLQQGRGAGAAGVEPYNCVMKALLRLY